MANTGAAFELRVYNYISDQIKKGVLGFDPKHVAIHRKKGYWSNSRESDIITDVSVEVMRAGATEPYFIWVIECKDLSDNVPVDDVEEFHNKIHQMAVHKGTIAARSGFSSGVEAYARNHKIGLMRVKSATQVTLLLEDNNPLTVSQALTVSENQLEMDFYGLSCLGITTSSFERFVRSELSEVIGSDQV